MVTGCLATLSEGIMTGQRGLICASNHLDFLRPVELQMISVREMYVCMLLDSAKFYAEVLYSLGHVTYEVQTLYIVQGMVLYIMGTR